MSYSVLMGRELAPAVSTLARVVDPEAVDAMSGPWGRLEIRVPASWARRTIEIVVPPRVACARCDGGGCDSCGKSGAFKLATAPERTLRAALPETLGGGVILRLVDPFGEGGPVEVLHVEVRPGEAPSDGVTLAAAHGPRPRAAYGAVALAVALALFAIAVVLATR